MNTEKLDSAEALETLRRQVLTYVAEHYDTEKQGEMAYDEQMWTDAVDEVVGPDEWWEPFRRDDGKDGWTDKLWVHWFMEKVTADPQWFARLAAKHTKEEIERYKLVCGAYMEIINIGLKAELEYDHQVRLFGEAIAKSDMNTTHRGHDPVRMAVNVIVMCRDSDPAHVVANYLINVKGGLMDATLAFLPDDDDEPPTGVE